MLKDSGFQQAAVVLQIENSSFSYFQLHNLSSVSEDTSRGIVLQPVWVHKPVILVSPESVSDRYLSACVQPGSHSLLQSDKEGWIKTTVESVQHLHNTIIIL